MKSKLISTSVSLFLSYLLVFGSESMHQFAFYVTVVMNVLAWIILLAGGIKPEVAARIRKWAWISLASTAVSIYALIVSGHPMLAASSFMVSSIVWMLAFKPVEA